MRAMPRSLRARAFAAGLLLFVASMAIGDNARLASVAVMSLALTVWLGLAAVWVWGRAASQRVAVRRLGAAVPAVIAALFALTSVSSAAEAIGLVPTPAPSEAAANGRALTESLAPTETARLAAATRTPVTTATPAATPTAAVTESATPTAAPTEAATASPTKPPTAAATRSPAPAPTSPTAALAVAFTGLTSPVGHNDYATAAIETSAYAICSITVTYKSGPSRAQGLGPQTTGADGGASWTWKIGPSTTFGSWPVTVTCSKGGRSATATEDITVS